MSRYVPGGSTSPTNPFSSTGAAAFYPTGGQGQQSSGSGVYVPTPSGGGSNIPGGAPDNAVQPGVVSINPLDPVESAKQAGAATQGMLDGLGSALFGPHTGILTGGLTGAIQDAQGPVGDLGRFVGGIPGGIGDTLKNAGDIVGGALERVPAGGMPTPNGSAQLDQQYAAAQSDPAFKEWLAQKDANGKTNAEKYQGDKGLFGTGVLGTEEHYKAQALRDFAQAENVKNPVLMPGAFQQPGSLADTVNNLMDGLGLISAGWTRTLANANRIEQLKQVGSGEYAYSGFLGTGMFAGEKTLNPAEQLAYQKISNKEWTNDQALDFLVASGMSNHDAGVSIAATLASPDVVASFGMGALAKAGVKGVQVVAGAEKAAALLEEANVALKAAEEAVTVAKAGSKAARVATKALGDAKSLVEARQVAVEAYKGYRTGDTIARLNVIDRAFQGSERAQRFITAFGRTYAGLEGTYLGRAAKVTRTLIDPMHAIDLHMPGNARMVDLYSDNLTKTLHNVMNPLEGTKNFDQLRALDKTGKLADEYARALATGMANRGREGILSLHQASAVDRGLAGALQTVEAGAGDVLSGGLREDVIASAAKHMREKDLLGWLREDITKNVVRQAEYWDEAKHLDLARKLESMFGMRTAEQWMELLPKMSKEQKSLYDFAYYAHANKVLLEATSIAKAAGHIGLGEGRGLDRLVMLSKNTLTRVGADSVLSKLKVAGLKQKKALAIIREWQTRYPELAYITIDPANPGKGIKQFIRYVEDHLEGFPMQVKDDELGLLPQDLQDMSATFAGQYQLGFRPREEFLWGIERANEAGGKYIAKTVPWADHVAEGGRGFRPGLQLPHNIAGMPLVGPAAVKAAKMVDYVGAGAAMLSQQVTGAQVHEIARQRFVSIATHSAFKDAGLSESVANKWWNRLQEFTREHQGYSGPRGFGKGDLYRALTDEGLVPQTMLNGSMKIGENDVLRLVLTAYDGDMRFIGLTQKLSGRVKKMVSAMTGYETNFAGQISEHVWPTMKFRYNPIFQLQEKVEPWVLSVQRGISTPFLTDTLSTADKATESLLQRMTDGSLIRQADLDQAEYQAQMLMGKRMASAWGNPTSRLSKIAARSGELMDVQGVKRIAALRTFRHGLANDIRGAWDEVMPGTWQDMKTTADAMAGHVLSEDDFAVQLLNENLFANDIIVKRLDKAGKMAGLAPMHAEWENAIKTGEWLRPSHVGELKALDLDHVAKGMGAFEDGTKVSTMADLRRVIAASDKPGAKLQEVSDFLRRLGADKDYVGRVENSLQFSWTGFWKEAEKRYSLTFEESKQLQDLIGGWADLRGLTPVDFMSQVFDPGIIDGTEGLLGSLDGPLGMLRKNAAGDTVGRGRSRLAAPADGGAKRDDLVRQMSAVFSAHLDPSAKRALLMEFRPELTKAVKNGSVRLHMRDIKAMWDADAEGQLADRILGYMDGKFGDGIHEVVTDPKVGIESLRNGADKYLRDHGVTPLSERRLYTADEAHFQQVADQYGAMPEVQYEKTGRRPSTKATLSADTDLKPQPVGVDDRTYKAWQQFTVETGSQFDFMVRPKSQGGLGIKVTVAKGEPYTADAAGRAALDKDLRAGRLRVKGIDSDHPVMTNEQVVQFRAVHEVFGHGAEGFGHDAAGQLNATANHFKMYSPEARGPMLSETHGQNAYLNYSNDVINGPEPHKPLDPTDPALDFEARHPFEVPKTQVPATRAPDEPLPDYAKVNLGGGLQHTYSRRLGDGIMAMPADMQAALLQPIDDLMNQFPELRVFHIDVVDFHGTADSLDDNMLVGLGLDPNKESPFAITFGADKGEPIILFNSNYADPKFWKEDWKGVYTTRNEATRQYDKFYVKTGKGKDVELPRKTAFGVAHNNPDFATQQMDIQSVMRHEAGHAFDVDRRPQYLRTRSDGTTPWLDKQGNKVWLQKPLPGYEDYDAMMKRFESEAGRLHLSEYAHKSSAEFAAELFSLSTDPSLDMAKLLAKSPDLHAMVDEFQTFLKKTGEWVPPVENPMAGKTIREAHALGAATAPQKVGLLPQETIDNFARQFVGIGKHVESNPDVARVAQHFGAWSQKAIENGLLHGDNAVHAGLIQDIAGIPTGAAAPYNFTEGMAHQLAVSAMQRKWQDAFRLQYFAQSRTMLERTINHPMFGLYPASYMWGKLMPEVVQFMAQRPFGIRTGGALSAMMHAKSEIALRREYDPAFDAQIEKLGHSQAMSFLGYMLPTLPWDISASAPVWMKDVAAQGTAQAKAVAAGQQPGGLDVMQPFTDTVKKLNPLETTIPWAGRAFDEANGANTPAEQLKQALANAKSGQVTAAELGTPLYYVMEELKRELSR